MKKQLERFEKQRSLIYYINNVRGSEYGDLYRFYQSGDEKKIVSLWNECLVKDPITSKRFRNLVLLDANFDPKGLRLAFEGDQLVGCVYAVRRLLPMYGRIWNRKMVDSILFCTSGIIGRKELEQD